ncbi:MAG TPA: hypothetical protein VMH33_09990 [Solirubrobacterales bacterium]|nr:hypothetical protein [Solirubrobacterales bacterium]
MKRLTIAIALALVGACLLVPVAQGAEFEKYALESVGAELSTTQAGAHPDFTTSFVLSKKENAPYARTREIDVKLPSGLFGNPQPFPICTSLQLGNAPEESECPQDAQVGFTQIVLGGVSGGSFGEPVYRMPTPPGAVARFGFFAVAYPTTIVVRLDPDDHTLIASVEGAPAAAELIAASTTFWGVPAAPVHNPQRITPLEAAEKKSPEGGRESTLPETPFMSNPTNCTEERQIKVTAISYPLPESPSTMTAPFPKTTGCGLVGFNPTVAAKPTTEQATTGSGLDYGLQIPTKGLEFPNLLYESEAKRAEVVLPEGMTINPSEAEGLGACSEEDLGREAYDSAPNEGCPETSKVGTVTAISPALSEAAEGSLYVAKPYENPFGSLIALYMVLKIPARGVLVKLAGEVRPNPLTGQLTTIFDDIPQLPVSSFRLHFREGARAPLVTPAACGTYTFLSHFAPWAAPFSDVLRESSFQITSGVEHGPCPSGGTPPFHPGLLAGTQNNAAGTYSPFDIDISRKDSEQEITHFSIKLPPGVTGKLAGIPFCSDQQIAAAKARERQPHGGQEEIEHPSCPQASEVGHTLAGAGVGQVLTYVPGKVYLAGPYQGSNLSIVAITAAKAGPFDLGTVVIREGLKVNPETAEVSVDAAGSDPIPHIVDGIPVRLRDIRVYVDRPEFVKNPTSCEPTSTASTVLGSGTNFASEADDRPVTVTSRFQAADCASLGFKPKLKISLKGSTRRAGLPALTAVVTPRTGDANIGKAVVTLPPSEFLEQAHIGNSCTRVQFNAGGGNGEQCPANSVLGHAVAVTPLLSEPLEGAVFLRSNGGERKLPDLVAALHSTDINIDLVGFISSLHKKGSDVSQIRSTFASVPDQPVTRFTLQMFGGKKGLLVNSTDLCKGTHKAISEFTGQNGKSYDTEPAVKVKCKRKHKENSEGHGRARVRAERAGR